MDFGNPMFLWALPAVLLPVILHLFFKRRKIRHWRRAGDPRRVQMGLVMIDAEERFLQDKGHGLGGLETDQQRQYRRTAP